MPALDNRGGSGDVPSVWHAFFRTLDCVVGVAGNHDLCGDAATRSRFPKPMQFLDDDTLVMEGPSIAGLSGIHGNPRSPWRRTEDDFVETLELLLCDPPAIVIMHDGPDLTDSGHRGSPRIRQIVEQAEPELIVRGHSHWKEPLATLSNGTQVLNVDARVVILTGEIS